MATHRRIKLNNIDNSGFGPNSNVEGGRLTNKDGSTNLRKTGRPFWERISLYHTMLRMPRNKFWLFIILCYTVVNLFFATIYFLIGVDKLAGINPDTPLFERFLNAFFFSSQTLTTVGYGHVAPNSITTSFVASIEAFVGILAFAMVTGLLYGRFTRPRAYLLFSHNALVAPYKGGRALMFRMATFKNNHLTDAEAMVTAAVHVTENGKQLTHFYPLGLEFSKVNSLALSWTVVHPLDEQSPLFGYSREDFLEARLELIVAVKAFDDHFSNTVQQRTSYHISELVYGARFLPMFHRAEDGTHTVLELDKINAHEPAKLAEPEMSVADTTVALG